LAALWVEGGSANSKVVAACLMMQNPAPSQQQLDAMKALVGSPPPLDLGAVLGGA